MHIVHMCVCVRACMHADVRACMLTCMHGGLLLKISIKFISSLGPGIESLIPLANGTICTHKHDPP